MFPLKESSQKLTLELLHGIRSSTVQSRFSDNL